MSERNIWLSTIAVVIILSAFFAAKAFGYIVGTKAFPTNATASSEPIKKRKKKEATKRDKSGQPLVDRNMFCLECVPTVEEQIIEGDAVKTSLPLKLVATSLANKEAHSFATILNTQTGAQGAYWVGDSIPAAGKVELVAGRYVEFVNNDSKRRERAYLFENAAPPPKKVEKKKPAGKPLTGKKKILADLETSVEKVSDTEFTIKRSAIEKAMDQPWVFSRMARVVKARKNGEEVGVRLYSIKKNSLLSKIGLKNGDTLHSINGSNISFNFKDMLDLANRMKTADSIDVSATRRNKPVNLKYNVQ